jgi:hypothetical protein
MSLDGRGATLLCIPVQGQTQIPPSQSTAATVKALELDETLYTLRAGEPARIVAPAETVEFIRTAKTRRTSVRGGARSGFVVGPNAAGDRLLLAASLTMPPGTYTVDFRSASGTGEERLATLTVVLNPIAAVPSTATQPPVILLNGLQFRSTLSEFLSGDTCPVSVPSDTFGSLENQLTKVPSLSAGNPKYPNVNGAGVPVVYFFDNCVEDQNGLIENLGNALGQVLNLIRYDSGALVPQVDLVTHSMGGLIARAYLSGLQTNGTFSPPTSPRVRKLIEIATPNFGSFFAENYSDAIQNGTQTAEMIPGSTFLLNLATWNQRGDDLRGVDGLAIIGDGGFGNRAFFLFPRRRTSATASYQ